MLNPADCSYRSAFYMLYLISLIFASIVSFMFTTINKSISSPDYLWIRMSTRRVTKLRANNPNVPAAMAKGLVKCAETGTL
jgi:hypothetical protein